MSPEGREAPSSGVIGYEPQVQGSLPQSEHGSRDIGRMLIFKPTLEY